MTLPLNSPRKRTAYLASGISFSANVLFPELPASAAEPDVCLKITRGSVQGLVNGPAYDSWKLSDGTPWLVCRRTASGYTFEFPSRAVFRVSHDARHVDCTYARSTSLATARHFWLDTLLDLVLSRLGTLTLHASCVAYGNRAVAFLGESGRGKSTLAAALVASGCPLLADDCVAIRQTVNTAFAIPSYPGLRLWPDSVSGVQVNHRSAGAVSDYSTKLRVVPPGFISARALPLSRLYFLGEEHRSVDIRVMEPVDAFPEALGCTYMLDLTDPAERRGHFTRVTNLLNSVACYRLSYPRDFSRTGEVAERLRQHIQSADVSLQAS